MTQKLVNNVKYKRNIVIGKDQQNGQTCKKID